MQWLSIDNRYSKKQNIKASAIKNIILSDDFWCQSQFVVDILQPIFVSVVALQDNYVDFGAGYHAFISIYSHVSEFDHELLTDELRDQLLDCVNARMNFIITPAHVVAYIFSNRFAKESSIGIRKVHEYFKLLKAYQELDSEDQGRVDDAINAFVNSWDASDWSMAWTDKERFQKSPLEWWTLWGKEDVLLPLRPILLRIYSLQLSVASSESTWSQFGYLMNKRRNRTSDDHANKLLNVFTNGRKIDDLQKMRVKPKEGCMGVKHCDQAVSFSHITFRRSTNPDEFRDMHGDEMLEEQDYGDEDYANEELHAIRDSDEEEEEVDESNIVPGGPPLIPSVEDEEHHNRRLSTPRAYVGEILDCPDEVPKDVKESPKDWERNALIPIRCAFWFDDGTDLGWFEGWVKEVNKRVTKKANCTAVFHDGIANRLITRENYGRDGQWVLLPAKGTSDNVLNDDEEENMDED